MTKYTIKTGAASQSQLFISYSFVAPSDRPLIQIPFWRPGRYEGGNFAANYRDIRVFTNESEVATRKISSHVLEVDAMAGTELICTYECYASVLSAGNTYYDSELLLINPVNSLVYAIGLEEDECEVLLHYPSSFKLGTGFPTREVGEAVVAFKARDVQHLLDTPILAASEMNVLVYEEAGIEFKIHVACEAFPDREKILSDFKKFTKSQIVAFKQFPVSDYHFLIILLPYKAYHGVEHENSTVIIFGDAADLVNRSPYLDLIGVSSHELYHTWNVKSLRPADWTPYDFSGESPSRLGYVAEGVTTYLGDWMLWNSGVFSDQDFLNALSVLYRRHISNEGRSTLSLADASVDTWVDGYGPATPRRRVSIYVEGALLAIICDLRILKASGGERGLNQFMKLMYEKYGGGEGYSEAEYWNEMEAFSDLDFSDLIEDVVDGKGHLEVYFKEAINDAGLEITESQSPKHWERSFGVQFVKTDTGWTVLNVLENSPAEQAGLWFGQKLIMAEGLEPEAFFAKNESSDKVVFKLRDKRNQKELELVPRADGRDWMNLVEVIQVAEEPLFDSWKNAIRNEKSSLIE